MKFSVAGPDLTRAMAIASKCVTRSVIDILNCARLSAAANDLQIQVTDMTQSVTISLPASVSAPGETAVSVEQLSWLAKDAEQVSGQLGATLRLRADSRSVSLGTFDPKDFPQRLEIRGASSTIVCAGKELLDLLRLVEFTQHSVQAEAHYNGILLEHRDGKLCAISSDGKVAIFAPSGIDVAPFPAIIIPRGCIGAIKAIADSGQDMELAISPELLGIRCGTISYTTKLVDAEFPTAFLFTMFRDADPSRVTVSASVMGGAMMRAAKFAENLAHTTYISATDGSISARAKSAVGELIEEIADVSIEGADVFFAVNSLHLGRVCSAVGGEIVIGIKSDKEPAMVTAHAHPGAKILMMLCVCNASDFRSIAEAA